MWSLGAPFLLLTACLAARASPVLTPPDDIQVQENFDVSRIYGKWFHVAVGSTCPWLKKFMDRMSMSTLVLGEGPDRPGAQHDQHALAVSEGMGWGAWRLMIATPSRALPPSPLPAPRPPSTGLSSGPAPQHAPVSKPAPRSLGVPWLRQGPSSPRDPTWKPGGRGESRFLSPLPQAGQPTLKPCPFSAGPPRCPFSHLSRPTLTLPPAL
uniref:Uncharacterized protein n=1 Tax=Canis lupus familiaris TaxID=9615 RepID=A0A8C0P1W0_CANLF